MWNYRFPGYICTLQIEPGRHVKPGGGKGPPEKNHPDIIGGGELFLTRMIPMAVRIERWWGWKQNDRCEEDALVDGWCRAGPRPHSLSYLYTHRALDRGSRRNIPSLLFSSDARNTKCKLFNWNITQLTKMTLELVFAVGFSPPSP